MPVHQNLVQASACIFREAVHHLYAMVHGDIPGHPQHRLAHSSADFFHMGARWFDRWVDSDQDAPKKPGEKGCNAVQ